MNRHLKNGGAQAIGWFIVCLTVLPLVALSAESNSTAGERLEWLLAQHDLRQAIHTTRAAHDECGASAEEAE